MPTAPISMRKLKEILRLKYGAGLSHRQIGRSLAISPSVVSRYANRAAQLGIKQWPLPAEWDDAALMHTFLQTQVKMKKHSLPDWATVYKELRNKCVTLQLLWEEYGERNPGGSYSYNHYCRMYREWLKTTSPSMRQVHKAGEKLFVDYCGPTVDITNPDTGEIRTAQIIVAVLGASSYTWAEATWSQQLEDWVMSHVRCFRWLDGVPELVVPDNLKSATSRACKYDPDVNPTYQQMLEHYNVAVIPARPRKPKDKAKAEVGVQIVERRILARLRHQVFFSLAELNHCIRTLVTGLNERPFKKLPGNRREAFERLDKTVLRPLPVQQWRYRHIKKAKVNIDYHVEYEQHHYSVPHQHVGKTVELHAFDNQLEVWSDGQMIASHPRRLHPGNSTAAEHMPERHRHHQQWTPERLKSWAAGVGSDTFTWVSERLAEKAHPEQAYRLCLGLLSLTREYPSERVNNSCRLANAEGLTRLKQIKSILKNNRDLVPADKDLHPSQELPQEHENIRGPRHFH
ncbi:Transposase for insertion sequences IS1326/IS1353 [Enterobacter hormaechei]|uniref:IS21 family transposase n=1 Tax=Enterobacter asburiae TaxID=61645 RepID=A0AAW7ZQT3_ENTAS|nr:MULTISPECIES: IS21 family transposase [Enterobacteriaceae]MCM6290603.1 IS21 family transposase [Klebsiella pneumoniae]HCP9988377.1 IS21 family transposase [Escherichia coli]HCT8711891.1 IS21 family transposase [Raoultella ornithinolytica]HDT4530429.1 IS21 family transposase [Enterobacter chengduensis]AVL16943.1 IS21 family transposase [Enterobacter cloacae]